MRGEEMVAVDYPQRRFTKAEIEAMTRCTDPGWEGRIAPEGFSLWRDSLGRLIVVAVEGIRARAFRPVIRVKARRGIWDGVNLWRDDGGAFG